MKIYIYISSDRAEEIIEFYYSGESLETNLLKNYNNCDEKCQIEID